MRCYEYCQVLFDEIFLPVLRERFPDILSFLSAGVVGQGSEVLGADDELSRDHSWGPGKCQLMLPEPDMKQYGPAISQELSAAVPDEFRGVSMAELRPDEIQVSTIDSVYQDLCGSSHPPVTLDEWASADANDLCYASSGFVLFDPSGVLAERISEFQKAYYPTDIWKWQVASHLWGIWHNGAYNSCDRLAKRGDGVGLLIGQGYFVEATLGLLCLLNRRFPVYWKWLHWQFQSLPKWIDVLEPSLRELESAADHETRAEIIRGICQTIREVLREAGLLPDAKWRNFMGSIEILQQIESTDVRALVGSREPHLDVW